MTSYFNSLPDAQQALILKHLELVLEANQTTNLTRITSKEEALTLHIEDSLAGLPAMGLAPEGLYGDLGSGGGYPGIPLAIATGRPTTLIDARQRKMVVMAQIIDDLGLSKQITTYAGRAELLARQHPASFAVLTARALAKLNVLLELASPLLVRKGVLVCYKSNVETQELADADRVSKLVGMKLIGDESFALGEFERRILTYQKTSSSKVKLPRQEGQAQKQPL